MKFLLLLQSAFSLSIQQIGSATQYAAKECGSINGQSCDLNECCSAYGHCGEGSEYCRVGCQSAFGRCDSLEIKRLGDIRLQSTRNHAEVDFAGTGTGIQLPGGNFGTLTWYQFNGGVAYCDGRTRSEDELVVALHTYTLNQYDCHKEQRSVQINAPNGKSVVAAVVDMCDARDGCVPGTVDGTQGVWHALDLNLDIGRLDITWNFV